MKYKRVEIKWVSGRKRQIWREDETWQRVMDQRMIQWKIYGWETPLVLTEGTVHVFGIVWACAWICNLLNGFQWEGGWIKSCKWTASLDYIRFPWRVFCKAFKKNNKSLYKAGEYMSKILLARSISCFMSLTESTRLPPPTPISDIISAMDSVAEFSPSKKLQINE